MSTGGIYQIIANDGKQDVLLVATDLLNKRLREIKKVRCKNPMVKDPMPTLVDIEKTHIFFLNAHFKPFVQTGYEYQTTLPTEGGKLGQTLIFSIPQYGDFFNDMVLHLRLTGLAPVTPGDKVKYCDYLGHKLCSLTQFEVNGNVIDEYDSDVLNFHYNFTVPEDKKLSWNRCVGQEVPKLATLNQNPGVDNYRERKFILDGNQTPKDSHPVVDLWIPLIFWFNLDTRLALPSIAIPYGQRFIKVLMARADEIAFGDGPGGGAYYPPQLSLAELYINNIFVNPEIHDIFIKRVGFAMIRVHRYQRNILQTSAGQVQLDQLKWPTETFYIGVKPVVNVGTAENWWKLHFVTPVARSYPVAVPNAFPPPLDQLAFADAHWYDTAPMIRRFSIETHGVKLYQSFPVELYNQYIPYHYGQGYISSPIDPGAYMATLNFYPGVYQPSGYINLSRSRELYFIYQSDIISPTINGILQVVTICINFLLISEGTAALRYNI